MLRPHHEHRTAAGRHAINPSYRTRLATIKSPNGASALTTASGASYYRIVGVSFEANVNGEGEVIALGRDEQTTLAEVPHSHRARPRADHWRR